MIANESHLHQRIESELTEAVTDSGDLISAISKTVTSVVENVVSEKDERIDELESRVDELEADLDTERDRRSAEIEGCHSRITRVEENSDENNTDDNRRSEAIEPDTSLEAVVGLPEPMAETELTANQQRARFIASDVMDYTTSTPKGRMVRSTEIATILKAGTDCAGRTETVSRVINFLERLGDDAVEIVERHGERRVVFDPDLAERLEAHANKPSRGTKSNHTVVTDNPA